MGPRVTGALVGAVFGAALSWTGMSSPEVIRGALLLENSYLFLMFGSAVLTAFVGLRVLRALRSRAVITGEPVAWSVQKPARNNVVGSVLFGTGWALSGACPGPIATQLGQGVTWSLFTIAGIVVGIVVFGRRRSGSYSRTDPLVGAAGGRELAQQPR
jgi:uncharacterized membrane protein YedE/YeeE